MIKSERHCVTCGKKHTFHPSLEDRGMTWKTAKALFIDTKQGQCSECWSAANGGKRHYTTAPTLPQTVNSKEKTAYINNV